MMVPTLPGTHFKMIQSDFTFSFFQCGLNGPSHSGDVRQVGLGIIGRCIAQIIFCFGLRAKRATEDLSSDMPPKRDRRAGLTCRLRSALLREPA